MKHLGTANILISGALQSFSIYLTWEGYLILKSESTKDETLVYKDGELMRLEVKDD